MKNHFKPHLQKLTRVQSSEHRDLAHGLRLDRNERTVDLPDSLIKAVYDSFPAHAFSAYPNCRKFMERLSLHLKLAPEYLYIFNGVTEGIRIIFETLTYPDDRILIMDPTYPMYGVYSNIFQLKVSYYGFVDDPSGGISINWKELYGKLESEDIKILFLINPNLPVETYVEPLEQKRLAKICHDKNIILVIDEAYCLFGAESALPLIAEFDNLIVMQSFSKAFGIAGLRLGLMASQSQNIEYLSKTRSITETDSFCIHVAECLLNNYHVVEDYASAVRTGAEYLKSELSLAGFKYHGGDYTNSILIFLPKHIKAAAICSTLAAEKIYVRTGFAGNYANCIRVTLGTQKQMQIFINKFKKMIE